MPKKAYLFIYAVLELSLSSKSCSCNCVFSYQVVNYSEDLLDVCQMPLVRRIVSYYYWVVSCLV